MFDFEREMRGRRSLSKTKSTIAHRNIQKLPKKSKSKLKIIVGIAFHAGRKAG